MRYIQCILFSSLLLASSSYAQVTAPQQDNSAVVVSSKQPDFTIKLKSNPSTGFSWFLADCDDKLIAPVSHHYQPQTSQLVGAPGYDTWTFHVKPEAFTVPRQTLIRLVCQRPWEALGQSEAQTFKVVTVK